MKPKERGDRSKLAPRAWAIRSSVAFGARDRASQDTDDAGIGSGGRQLDSNSNERLAPHEKCFGVRDHNEGSTSPSPWS